MIVFIIRRCGRWMLQFLYSRPGWQVTWTILILLNAGILSYLALKQEGSLMLKYYFAVLLIKILLITGGCMCARKLLVMVTELAEEAW